MVHDALYLQEDASPAGQARTSLKEKLKRDRVRSKVERTRKAEVREAEAGESEFERLAEVRAAELRRTRRYRSGQKKARRNRPFTNDYKHLDSFLTHKIKGMDG